MKRTITLILWMSVLLLGVNLKGMAGTTLSAGDIVFVAINGDTDDTYAKGFSFMPLVDLEAGTEIYFTDYGWSDVAGAFINNSSISDLFIKYTAPTGGVKAGTVIRNASNLTTDFAFFYTYGISTYDYVNIVGVTASDEVLAFQGSIASPTFIFAASYVSTDVVSSGWATNVPAAGGTNGVGSALPGTGNDLVADLVDDVTALSFNRASTGNDNCAYTGDTSPANKADWQARIRNYSNWTFNDAKPIPTPPIGPFVVLVAPTATTDAANSLTSSGATMNGTVNANNAATSVTFEYGLTTAYGSSVTALESPVNGTSAVAVSYVLGGLAANTTYHYRVVATNSGGTTYGDDVTFATSEVTGMDYATNEPLVLYPNPTQDGFYVNAGEAACELTICNLSGQVVYRQSVSKGSFVAMASFASGVYLVKLNDKIQKLIKN